METEAGRMLGHPGFSYTGGIFLLMLFIPNLIWTRAKPAGYAQAVRNEDQFLQIAERAGQVLVTSTALLFRDYDLRIFSLWSLWLIGALLLMLLYEANWIRYFSGKKTMDDFYGSFLGIPVPAASLPVAAFLLLGIYGKVIWLILSVILLGIGHIGIHLRHRREM